MTVKTLIQDRSSAKRRRKSASTLPRFSFQRTGAPFAGADFQKYANAKPVSRLDDRESRLDPTLMRLRLLFRRGPLRARRGCCSTSGFVRAAPARCQCRGEAKDTDPPEACQPPAPACSRRVDGARSAPKREPPTLDAPGLGEQPPQRFRIGAVLLDEDPRRQRLLVVVVARPAPRAARRSARCRAPRRPGARCSRETRTPAARAWRCACESGKRRAAGSGGR